jgi:hypothetical protein
MITQMFKPSSLFIAGAVNYKTHAFCCPKSPTKSMGLFFIGGQKFDFGAGSTDFDNH